MPATFKVKVIAFDLVQRGISTLCSHLHSVHFCLQEFQAAKKEGTGFISRMADSFHNMSAAYMMKTRSPEFTIINEYIQMFGEKVAVLDRISQRILKEQYGESDLDRVLDVS